MLHSLCELYIVKNIWYLCITLMYLSGQFDIFIHQCSTKTPPANLYLTFVCPLHGQLFFLFLNFPSTSADLRPRCWGAHRKSCCTLYLCYVSLCTVVSYLHGYMGTWKVTTSFCLVVFTSYFSGTVSVPKPGLFLTYSGASCFKLTKRHHQYRIYFSIFQVCARKACLKIKARHGGTSIPCLNLG